MSMSRKDYTAIANILGTALGMAENEGEAATVDFIAEYLKNYFAAQNPHFKPKLFLDTIQSEAIEMAGK